MDLHEVFLMESKELIATMEQALLRLEEDHTRKESIQEAFRAMHTLKGTAGMVGYDSIASLLHELESIYVVIRDGALHASPALITVSLQAVDHLHKLMQDPQLTNTQLKARHEHLKTEIEAIKVETQFNNQSVPEAATVGSPETFYILFQPKKNTLLPGVNLLMVMDDLAALGDAVCLPFFSHSPTLEKQDEKSYTGFEVLLRTHLPEATIADVFLFVTDHEITITKIEKITPDVFALACMTLQQQHNFHTSFGLEAIQHVCRSGGHLNLEKLAETPTEIKKGHTQKSTSTIRVPSERLDELMNLISELVTTQARLSLYASRHNGSGDLPAISENVEKITRRLRDNAFTICLVPIETLVTRFQRLVRDLSTELHKEVSFIAKGTDTEIDKSMIEKLTDPLLHILRNCIDHGIEMPDERQQKGKPRKGTILMNAQHAGAHVIISIKDDGAGIHPETIRQKAISKKLIAHDAALTDKELINLIFLPGFSTAEHVTSVSGRGVGMDVVKRNISDIRGEIQIDSQPERGTELIIRLPLTLSIVDGLLISIGPDEYVMPLSAIEKCYEVPTQSIKQTFNDLVELDGQRVPFYYLREEFNVTDTPPLYSQVITVKHKETLVGLVVDSVNGECQAVLKPLGSTFHNQDEFSGATILGDGTVALVVDPQRLIQKLRDTVKQHIHE
jgi:two-component system, chemotaxis family, sensor kinase CheA